MLGPDLRVLWTARIAWSKTTTSGFSYFMEFTSFLYGLSQLRKRLFILGFVRAGKGYSLAGETTQPTFKSDRPDKRDERDVFAKCGFLDFFQQAIAVHDPH